MNVADVIKFLRWLNATVGAIIEVRQISRDIINALKQSKVFTPEENAQLDAEAEAIFAAPESQPSGR